MCMHFHRMYPMFTCDEEALRRHDKSYIPMGDTKELDPEVLHSVLAFIDTNGGECDSVDINPEVKRMLDFDSAVGEGKPVQDTFSSMVQLKRVGDGIREQCKMIADVSYNLENVEVGNEILSQLCDMYSYFYRNCQEHKGVVGVRKDQMKFRTLFGKRRNKGFFRRRRIVPLYPPKMRRARKSRFGARDVNTGETTSDDVLPSTTTTSEDCMATTTSDEFASQGSTAVSEDMSVDTELNDVSPFIDLEAYKGQDVIKSREHTTPGLLPRSD